MDRVLYSGMLMAMTQVWAYRVAVLAVPGPSAELAPMAFAVEKVN